MIMAMIVCFSGSAFASTGDVTWEYGDTPQAGKQEAAAMAVDSAGNTIIVGASDQSGTDNYYTVKILADGSGASWNKTFDKNSGDDHATAVVVDTEDNVIVTGYVWSGSSYDFHTIKYSSADGTVLWEHTFNAEMNGNDLATAVAVDSVNNVYVAGYSQGASGADDYMIVKYGKDGPNPDGTPVWTKNYNGPANSHDRITSISAGPDGIAVTGESRNASDFDILTAKYGFDSSFVWEKRKSVSGDDKGIAVRMDSSGNVIMTGLTHNGTNKDLYIVKYDGANGTETWQHTYNNGSNEEPADLHLDASGNVYVTGYRFVAGSANDIYTLMFSSSGTELWTHTFNSSNGNSDQGVSIAVDESGDVFVTGDTYDDAALNYNFQTIKYSKGSGALLWNRVFDGTAGRNDRTRGIGLTSSGEPIVAGWTDKWTSGASDYDYYAVKYDPGLLNPPTNLSAATISTSQIDLSWDDNSSNEEGFRVERKIGDFGIWSEITTKGPGVSAHSDTGLASDTKYYYRVRAYNAANGNSHYSNEAYAVTTIFTYSAPAVTCVYDGPDSGDDYVAALASGPDNTPVITGYSYSIAGQFDYYTVKRHKDTLALVWEARYEGDQDDIDIAKSLIVDSNNDVVVTGYSLMYSAESAGNSNDIYTIKYPSAGPPSEWADPYNGPAGDDDRSSVVDVSTDGANNYVVVGYGKNADWNDDIYVVKYVSDGTRAWEAVPYDRGVSGSDYPSAVAFDPSGDILVAGYTSNGLNYDYFVRKYNGSDGTVAWTDVYDVAGTGDDFASSLAVDSSGDVYVTGTAVTVSGNDDFYTIKYNGTNGSRLWEKLFNGPGNGMDEAITVRVDPVNDEPVVAGTTADTGNDKEFHIIRYDTDGNVVWERTVDRPGSTEIVTAMEMDKSGNVHVAGYTDNGSNRDVLSVQFDSEGSFLGGSIYNSSANDDDEGTAVTVNTLGEAFVGGYSVNAGGDADYVVYKVTNNLVQTPIPVTAAPVYEEVELSWSNNSVDEDGFHLERKIGTCASTNPWNQLYTAAADEITYTDTNLAIDGQYCYRVRTYKNNGETSRWAEKAVTTLVPAAPVLTAVAVNTTRIDLSWTNSTAVEDGFKIERCEGAGCVNFAEIGTTGPDVTTYSDNSLCNGRTYRYRVEAYRTAHWATGYSNIASDDTPAPAATGSTLSATRISEAEIELQWTDAIGDETGYRIERCTGSGCVDFAEIDTKTTTHLKALFDMDEPVWDGTADEVADSSGYENHATAYNNVTTVSGGHTGRAGSFDGTNDYVSWSYKGGAPANNFTIAAWVKATTTHENDTEGSTGTGGYSGQKYVFYPDNKVSNAGAGISVGTGGISVYEQGTSYMPPLAVYSGSIGTGWNYIVVTYTNKQPRIYLNGVLVRTGLTSPRTNVYAPTSAGGGSYGYFAGIIDEVRIYDRPLTADEVYDQFNGLTSNVRFSDTTVAESLTYTYRVRGYKTATCEGGWDSPENSNTASAVTTLNDPSGLTATAVNTTQINLSWTNSTVSETGFTIERCEGAACDFTTKSTYTAAAGVSSYSDTEVCQSRTYKYQLKAVKDDAEPLWETGWTDPAAQATTSTAAAAVLDPVTPVSESRIDLAWTDNSSDETGFKIQRCAGDTDSCPQDTDFSTVGTVDTVYGDAMVLHMDEASWNGVSYDVIDSSSNTNNGRAYNGANTVASGKFGRAGSFDGVNDYIYIPHHSSINPANAITVALWAKSNTTTWNNYYFLASKRDAFMLGPQSGSKMMYFYVYVNNGWRYASFTPSIDITQWHHYAGTYDGTTIKLYIDGSPVASTTYAGTINNDTGYLAIGLDDGQARYFNGFIDEVAIFNRALGDSEISALTGTTVNPRTYSDTGLSPGTTYTYRVNAYKTATCDGGWELNGNKVEGVTDTLPAPSDLTATAVNTTQVNLSWTNGTTSETGFVIERCEGAGCDFTIKETFTAAAGAQAYSDIMACQNKTYSYRVKAVKEDAPPLWETGWSDPTAQASTPPAAAPGGFKVAPATETTLDLTWTDNTAAETGFKIERCVGAGCTDFTPFKTLVTMYPSAILHMDEASWNGTADEVADSTGNGNDGTATNGVTTVAGGKFGRAGNFDAVDDYINVPHDSSINPSGAISVALWAKSNNATWNTNNALASKRDAYMLAPVNATKQVRFYIYTTTWYYTSYTTTADITQWHHYAGTYDGANIKLYIDGSLVASTPLTGAINTDTGPLTIGRDDGQSAYFYGQIDEVAIYNRALSGTEVTEHATRVIKSDIYKDTGLTLGETYRYRVYAYKTAGNPACDWQTTYLEEEAVMSPPAPDNVAATAANTTQIDLTWTDKTNDETSFTIERCEGAACDFSSVDTFSVPANTTSYSDTGVCESKTYKYRIRAENTGPAWNQTGWSDPAAQATTLSKAAPSGLTAASVSEMQIDLNWTPVTTDETGFKIERCQGAGCSNFSQIGTAAPDAAAYHDIGLTPGTAYTYKVRAYKTAACNGGWDSDYSNTDFASTASVSAPVLTATPVNTTQIDLAWTHGASYETGFKIERCEGTGCSNFEYLTTVGPDVTAYSDNAACNARTYNYRVMVRNEGLSGHGGGCWTGRVPLSITDFQRDYDLNRIVINHADYTGMNADFSDIRFYDETAKVELPYWVEKKTDGATATVWFKTFSHNTVYMYYGNADAESSGSADSFYQYYETFQGTAIDTSRWVKRDPIGTTFTQNNGLVLSTVNTSWRNGLISQQTFSRVSGKELYVRLTISADTAGSNLFVIGWGVNQTTTAYYDQFSHGLYFKNYVLSTYEGATETGAGGSFAYAASTEYEVKIQMKTSGARYFIKGGAYGSWTLVKETSGGTASPVRLSIVNNSHAATIHEISVRTLSSPEPAVNIQTEQTSACYTFTNTWDSIYSNEDEATTNTLVSPAVLSAAMATDTQIDLAWTYGSADLTGFKVERCEGSGCTVFGQTGTAGAGGTTYSDTTVNPETTYCYRVRAYKTAACEGGWDSSYTNEACDETGSGTPTGLTAAADGSLKILLNWTDTANNEDGFEIETQIWNGTFVKIHTTGANVTTYTDTKSIQPEKTYTYRVRSYRLAEKSSYSNEASATTPVWQDADGTCE